MERTNDLTPNTSDGRAGQDATFSALSMRLSKFAIRKRYAFTPLCQLRRNIWMGDKKTTGQTWQETMGETHPFSVVLREYRMRVSAVACILSLVSSRKEKNMGQRKQGSKVESRSTSEYRSWARTHMQMYPDKGYPCGIRPKLE